MLSNITNLDNLERRWRFYNTFNQVIIETEATSMTNIVLFVIGKYL